MTPARLILLVLATLRLTRLVTRDWLGEWTIVRPAKRWASRYEDAAIEARTLTTTSHGAVVERRTFVDGTVIENEEYPEPLTPQGKLVKGLDCPFCVGFWIGLLVLVGNRLFGRNPLWRLLLGGLAMNYAVGHISSRID